MKTIFFYTFLLLLKTQLCSADSLVFLKTIPIEARLVSTDPVGNIYLVKENNTLLRLNDKGDSIGVFNEIKKGKISHIDASNPLRILLFFSDYNQLVVLNNMLTRKNVYQLNSIGLNNVSCIANSADGNIWLYDQSSGSLLKVNEQLTILQNTNLRTISENPTSPTDMTEYDRALYIADTVDGIRKFDQFGFYNTTYHIKTSSFQFFNAYLVYFSTPYLFSYHTKSFTERKLPLPEPENILQLRVERNRLVILRKDRVDLFELIQ
ncbi:MAG: hypothetical protein K9I70_09490 [Chitinophagaceae bacterium]|nr:hypothetical protein [Chitinophagaceae bacterium]